MDHSMSDHAEMSEIYMFIICDAGLIYKGGLYSSCIMGDAKQEGADSMSIEKAKAYLEEKGLLEHVIELEASTATVEDAARALGVAPGMIAKTMSFLQGEQPVLILIEGTAKVDNRKYKDTFPTKVKMIPFDQVEQWIGHAPGGVCPFGVKDGVEVYLDESLRQFETVYPAAGNDHSAVRLTILELEQAAGARGWVDVCRAQTEPAADAAK